MLLLFINRLGLFWSMNRYLICVNTHMKELKPFGDVPKKLSVQVKRSFVATRTFTQALNTGRDVISKMQSVFLHLSFKRLFFSWLFCDIFTVGSQFGMFASSYADEPVFAMPRPVGRETVRSILPQCSQRMPRLSRRSGSWLGQLCWWVIHNPIECLCLCLFVCVYLK